MKRVLAALIIAVVMTTVLCGCGGKSESAQQSDADSNRFAVHAEEYIPEVGYIVVIEDTMTGVLYLRIASRDCIAVLPLIDENGSPLLSDEN